MVREDKAWKGRAGAEEAGWVQRQEKGEEGHKARRSAAPWTRVTARFVAPWDRPDASSFASSPSAVHRPPSTHCSTRVPTLYGSALDRLRAHLPAHARPLAATPPVLHRRGSSFSPPFRHGRLRAKRNFRYGVSGLDVWLAWHHTVRELPYWWDRVSSDDGKWLNEVRSIFCRHGRVRPSHSWRREPSTYQALVDSSCFSRLGTGMCSPVFVCAAGQ